MTGDTTRVRPRPGPSAPGPAGVRRPPSAGPLVVSAAFLAPGCVAFWPVFGDLGGVVAAAGGAVAGSAVAAVVRWRGWTLPAALALLTATYLVLGGPLALPATTVGGVVPTLDTLTRLVPLAAHAWVDLLTLVPPASGFVGPAVVPYLAGLVLGAASTALLLRPRPRVTATLPSLGLLVVAIAWGVRTAPHAWLLGVAWGAAALLWSVWRRRPAAGSDPSIFVGGGERQSPLRAYGPAATVVVGAATLALVAAPLLAWATPRRHVLRELVEPPLSIEDYATPLAQYRYLELDQKDVTLFRVAGLPAGARLRLASLDHYDGTVFSMSSATAGFVRMGERRYGEGPGTPAELTVDVVAYEGMWLPGGGDVRRVAFTGPAARAQTDTLYLGTRADTLLTTAGVAAGDRYALSVVLPPVDTAEAPVVRRGPVSDRRVPEAVSKLAAEVTGDATSPLEQLRRIEHHLATTGYYSNGSDGRSRSGHNAERLGAMLAAQQLVGDDEQYAVLMALMARQLQIPARVVVGFYPDDAGAPDAAERVLDVTGATAHVWVEAPTEAGWARFDPTPSRDRVPQTPTEQPRNHPRPQVVPPPEVPGTVDDPAADDEGRRADSDQPDGADAWLRVLAVAGGVVGVTAVVATPFLLIGAAKRTRCRRRRTAADLAVRVGGAWYEVVDAATDLGHRLDAVPTRRESAARLAARFPQAQAPQLAVRIDAGVFGAHPPTEAAAAAVWADADATLTRMRAGLPWWRRALAWCSLRSFVRPATPRTWSLPSWLRRGAS